MNRHQITNRSLVKSADRDSQDKNLVGLLDRFAKTVHSCDSVNSILTHVCPIHFINIEKCKHHITVLPQNDISSAWKLYKNK